MTTSATKPSARDSHSSVLYDGQMVMFGGHDDSNRNDVWALNLTSYDWTEVTTSTTKPSARQVPSCILYDGQNGFVWWV